MMSHTLKNIKTTFLSVLFTKLFVLTINSVEMFFIEEKMLLTNLLRQFLKSMTIAKKVIKKHFNKNLAMSAEEVQKFQLSNK